MDDFGLKDDTTKYRLTANLVNDTDHSSLNQVISTLAKNETKTNQKLAEHLKLYLSEIDPIKQYESLIGTLLTKDFEPKNKSLPTSKFAKSHPEIASAIHDLMFRLIDVRDQILSINTYQRAIALYDFAEPFLSAYDEYKLLHGKLDYQDLIEKSQELLQNSSMSQWVLFRLDGGIDHVLVDEAQDTSPDQWRLIKCLTEEFTSGQGASDMERTIFVVGDEKQSIYSFQGADPKYFGEVRSWFEQRLTEIEKQLRKQDLLFSFRSAEPILKLVDHTFVGDARKGIMGDVLHRAFDAERPGRVELWPVVEAVPDAEDKQWFEPLDRPSESDPRQLLAVQIAKWIETTIQSGQQINDGEGFRPVRAGDFLILVQSRSPLFRAIIKELKARSLNVAGADRLEVGQELAVKDILSLLKFAATPEDDLSLAEAMRSPLLNITEGELFTLAHGRSATLWQSFREQKENFPSAQAIIDDVLTQSGWMRPFELIDRILTLHKGRENLLDRLGEEAEDGIDELLSQAMRYEQTEAPTLTGFLNWFASGKVEIKREMDSAAGQIRVMTVHASKGLEAPIVILPDTVGTRLRDRSEVVPLDENIVAWKANSNERNKVEQQAVDAGRELSLQEKLRLLYVALTRAESWLVVCGAGKLEKEPALNWYNLVADGMRNAGAEETENGLVLQNGYWPDKCTKTNQAVPVKAQRLPAWMTTPAPATKARVKTLSPSDLGGAKTLASEIDDGAEIAAKRRGTLIHLLLEQLPSRPHAQWDALAHAIFRQFDNKATPVETDELLEIAKRVLNTDAFASIFGPDSLAEVAITAPLSELDGNHIYGNIDRLVVTNDKVLMVDFKSNRSVPKAPADVPDGLLRQMGAYLSALRPIYPDHEIEIAILWTETQQLMFLPHDIVIDALKASTTS
jgi:ATP-dependent helicase/nuclease subunit A